MIKNFEQLGEVLAEIEDRLSYLENSQHSHLAEEPKAPETEWTKTQWGIVNELRSEIRGWRQKYNETLLELEKKKPKPKRKVEHD